MNYEENQIIRVIYTNYKGETAERTIVPLRIIFAKNEWHPTEQWLLECYDLDKKATRTYALKDIEQWLESSNVVK